MKWMGLERFLLAALVTSTYLLAQYHPLLRITYNPLASPGGKIGFSLCKGHFFKSTTGNSLLQQVHSRHSVMPQ
jgi:hypothetical protein